MSERLRPCIRLLPGPRVSGAADVPELPGEGRVADRLIDRWMPAYAISAGHRTAVAAPATTTYDALLTADLARGPALRTLLALRALPAAVASRERLRVLRLRWGRPVTLERLEEAGFRILDRRAPEEVVLGLEGRFWTLTGGVVEADAAHFRERIPAGVVRVLWNFTIRASGPAACELATETRIGWSDPGAGRAFLAYWRIIRPFSGLTRTRMLRAIRRAAEGAR